MPNGPLEEKVRVIQNVMPGWDEYAQNLAHQHESAQEMRALGLQNMKSGNIGQGILGGAQTVLGSALPAIAPVGAAFDTAVQTAKRISPHAGHAVEVASMVNPEMPIFGASKFAGLSQHLGDMTPTMAMAGMAPRAVRSTELPAIRELPVDEAIKIARREPHLIPSSSSAEGAYVGGPREIENKRQLNALRKEVDNYIAADPRGGDWYDRYRNAVTEVTGGDPAQNKWMTSQHGQFSAGVSPESELAFAIKENNASVAGMPVKAARPAQHEAHNAAISALDPNLMQLGEKTGEYARLVSPDQERLPGATGVNDFRHARNFKYTEASGDAQRDALTSTQHKFLDYETALAVDRANKTNLGGRSNWTGEQWQAAPWVRQKALDILDQRPNLIEQHMPVQLALAKASGLEGDAAIQAAQREARRLGYEDAFKEANKTIGDFFDKHTAFATHEPQPGSLTGHLPGSVDATEAERAAYAADPRSTWAFAPGNRDALYSGLGVPGTGNYMRVRPTNDMQGVYTTPGGVTETNPGQVARPLVSFNSGPVKTVGDADRVILDTAEKVRAFLDAQNAGAWHKPWAGGKAGLSNSYFLPMDRPATLDEIMKMKKSLEGRLSDVVDTGQGLTITNFGDKVPQWTGPERKAVEQSISQGAPVGATRAQRVAVDSGYAGLEDLWPQGNGAVTRDVLKDINQTPELRCAFDTNAYIPQKALMNLERDAD